MLLKFTNKLNKYTIRFKKIFLTKQADSRIYIDNLSFRKTTKNNKMEIRKS